MKKFIHLTSNIMEKYESIEQIQVCRGADDRPFVTALTDNGNIWVSYSMPNLKWELIHDGN